MVANLSHDLRTPLTVIIGYLQLIRLEKNVNEPVNSYIEHIEKKADYLKKLVDDLYLLFWSEVSQYYRGSHFFVKGIYSKFKTCLRTIRY